MVSWLAGRARADDQRNRRVEAARRHLALDFVAVSGGRGCLIARSGCSPASHAFEDCAPCAEDSVSAYHEKLVWRAYRWKGCYEAEQVPADDRRQKALTAELNIFYDAVIAALRDAESFIIFGPGEAKGELKKRLAKRKSGRRIAAVEAADKMTDRQIAAKVREYFSVPWSAKAPKRGRANAGLRGESPAAPR